MSEYQKEIVKSIMIVVSWVFCLSISFFLITIIVFSYNNTQESLKEAYTLSVSFFAGISTLFSVLFIIFTMYKDERNKLEIKEKEINLRLFDAYKNYYILSENIHNMRHKRSDIEMLRQSYELNRSKFALCFWEIKALSEVIKDREIKEAFLTFQQVHEKCMISLINLPNIIKLYENKNIDDAKLQQNLDEYKTSFKPFNMTKPISIITKKTTALI
ncbi:hypothetical protein [Acinetobacter sp. UBA2581]|uniref:hypothetical protein n=1 Tax=Acinetobacter sp. UBA2581 TaxID=1945932 RepID=UPI00257C58EE|nr:hypothetical protein [Acinetobacter sp. UBA2581]